MSRPPFVESRRPSARRLIGFTVLVATVSWGLGAFAAWPWPVSDPGAAIIRIAFKHVAALEHDAPVRSKEELDKLPRHMRPQNLERSRTGTRVATVLRVTVDGQLALERRYAPGGFRHDGPAFGYEEVSIAPGRRRLALSLADQPAAGSPHESQRVWRLEQDTEIPPGRALLVEFSEETGLSLR